jgi:hypothetical protein
MKSHVKSDVGGQMKWAAKTTEEHTNCYSGPIQAGHQISTFEWQRACLGPGLPPTPYSWVPATGGHKKAMAINIETCLFEGDRWSCYLLSGTEAIEDALVYFVCWAKFCKQLRVGRGFWRVYRQEILFARPGLRLRGLGFYGRIILCFSIQSIQERSNAYAGWISVVLQPALGI